MSKPRLPKREYFAHRLAEIKSNPEWQEFPNLVDKAAYFQRRLDEFPPVPPPASDSQPMLHDMTIKQLLRSMEEDAEAIAMMTAGHVSHSCDQSVLTLVGNIQQAIMHINEHIGQ
jgi:hypothetical protein